MDQEELKELIRENRELAEENNELLHKIYRSVIWRRIVSIAYWVLIIGVAVGAFYFLQPVVQPFWDAYEKVQSGFSPTDQIENMQGTTSNAVSQ